jgi:hypothetical protein
VHTALQQRIALIQMTQLLQRFMVNQALQYQCKKISWDTEVKKDLDGIEKFFVYLDIECQYEAGNIVVAEGIEKIEWVKPEDLHCYDIVPPSEILFQKTGLRIRRDFKVH